MDPPVRGAGTWAPFEVRGREENGNPSVVCHQRYRHPYQASRRLRVANPRNHAERNESDYERQYWAENNHIHFAKSPCFIVCFWWTILELSRPWASPSFVILTL